MRAGKGVVVGVVLSLLGLSIALGGAAGCHRGSERTPAAAAVPKGAIHMTLTVRGLDGLEGERGVEAALCALDGVYQARASHDDRAIEVWYDPGRIDATAMKDAIAAAGYFPEE